MSAEMIHLLDKAAEQLGRANALTVGTAARDVVNVAVAIIRDQENRITRLERQQPAPKL